MNRFVFLAVSAAALPLAACGGQSASENLAEQVEASADNRATALENQAGALRSEAEALENRAENTRDVASQRGDAIIAADRNVQAKSEEQRQAIIANEAAAVR